MAIDILRDSTIKSLPDQVARVRNSASASRKDKAASTNNPVVNNPSLDNVVFTQEAKTVAKGVEIARDADGIDYDKVNAIKQQLANGTYEFNFERTAEKFLNSTRDLGFLYS